MKTPIMIVNFKAYETSIGKNAVKLAKICGKTAKSEKVNIIAAVQSADIFPVSNSVSIPIFAQHIDDVEYGAYTGSVLGECAKENGAIGSLVNHSEKRIDYETIRAVVNKAKRIGLITVVCAQSAEEAGMLAEFKPDFIAYEPPELIGGNVSVSTAKPEIIKKCVGLVGNRSILLVGAGVKTKKDVETSLKLGAKGVLLASGVTKAKNPEKVLKELAEGMK